MANINMNEEVTFFDETYTVKEVIDYVVKFYVQEEGWRYRKELCAGCCPINRAFPRMFSHTDTLGCCRDWNEMSIKRFKDVYNRIEPSKLLRILEVIMDYFHKQLPEHILILNLYKVRNILLMKAPIQSKELEIYDLYAEVRDEETIL